MRIVDRSPDLTVTLANDYLEPRLAELNKQRVKGKAPWLLVQPSGPFPLVGPVFRPCESACWTCLFDRMIRNREIKGFLDREGQAVAVSPLAHGPFGQSAIQFASVEIAKAIACGFRTDLRDHIVSLDLMGATIAKHFVAHRPQCPTCGNKKLQDPKREPQPIEVSAGTRLIMTSGGYRSVSSRATVARNRKHVSPLTGVVTKLEQIEAELPMNTNFHAKHNFSAPATDRRSAPVGTERRQLWQGLDRRTGRSQRADGSDRALFRHFPGRRDQGHQTLHRFRPGRGHPPNDVLLFSEAQFARADRPTHDGTQPVADPIRSQRRSSNGRRYGRCATDDSDICRPACCISSTAARRSTRIPTAARPATRVEEAIVQGFLELVERDAYAIWWYNRRNVPRSTSANSTTPMSAICSTQFADTGRKLWVLDITSDLGVPTYVAMLHWMQNGKENIEFGSGAHFDKPHRAVAGADRAEPVPVDRH